MNLWDLKCDSPVTTLSNRHTRHYATGTKKRERSYAEYVRFSYFSKCVKLFSKSIRSTLDYIISTYSAVTITELTATLL
jgi:hypothetical protein